MKTNLDRHRHRRLLVSSGLMKIELTSETFEDAEEFLSVAGLDAYGFYPDLPGLALKHENQVERTIRLGRKLYPGSFK